MSEANVERCGTPNQSVDQPQTDQGGTENPGRSAGTDSKHFGMDVSRWNDLVFGDADQLTPEEFAEGWHWCCEFDGLLIHPSSPEMEFCTCFEPETKPGNHDVA